MAALSERALERFARAGRDVVDARRSIDVTTDALVQRYGAVGEADRS